LSDTQGLLLWFSGCFRRLTIEKGRSAQVPALSLLSEDNEGHIQASDMLTAPDRKLKS